MTVFVPHETKDDISPAVNFGPIRYVNKFYIHGDELERQGDHNLIPTGYRANMYRVRQVFNPDKDYVLMVGDHLQLVALLCYLCSEFGRVTVLRWDRLMQGYIPVTLSSGLVLPHQPVLSSSDIGEKNAQDRSQGEARFEDQPYLQGSEQGGLEGPFSRDAITRNGDG